MARTIKGGNLKQKLKRGVNQDKEEDKVKMENTREDRVYPFMAHRGFLCTNTCMQRDRERDGQRERKRDGHRKRARERNGQNEREGEREMDRQRERTPTLCVSTSD